MRLTSFFGIALLTVTVQGSEILCQRNFQKPGKGCYENNLIHPWDPSCHHVMPCQYLSPLCTETYGPNHFQTIGSGNLPDLMHGIDRESLHRHKMTCKSGVIFNPIVQENCQQTTPGNQCFPPVGAGRCKIASGIENILPEVAKAVGEWSHIFIPNPGQNRPYPHQNRPYPDQYIPYPDQNRPYPDKNRPYPDQYIPYPDQYIPYPDQNRPCPDQNRPPQNGPATLMTQGSRFPVHSHLFQHTSDGNGYPLAQLSGTGQGIQFQGRPFQTHGINQWTKLSGPGQWIPVKEHFQTPVMKHQWSKLSGPGQWNPVNEHFQTPAMGHRWSKVSGPGQWIPVNEHFQTPVMGHQWSKLSGPGQWNPVNEHFLTPVMGHQWSKVPGAGQWIPVNEHFHTPVGHRWSKLSGPGHWNPVNEHFHTPGMGHHWSKQNGHGQGSVIDKPYPLPGTWNQYYHLPWGGQASHETSGNANEWPENDPIDQGSQSQSCKVGIVCRPSYSQQPCQTSGSRYQWSQLPSTAGDGCISYPSSGTWNKHYKLLGVGQERKKRLLTPRTTGDQRPKNKPLR